MKNYSFVVAKQQRVNWTAKLFLKWWQDAFTSWCNYDKISNLCCFVVLKYGRQLSSCKKILACLTVLRLWRHQRLTNLPNRFFADCMFMHRNKLSVRGLERSVERQKPFDAKFMWTRPCTSLFWVIIWSVVSARQLVGIVSLEWDVISVNIPSY